MKTSTGPKDNKTPSSKNCKLPEVYFKVIESREVKGLLNSKIRVVLSLSFNEIFVVEFISYSFFVMMKTASEFDGSFKGLLKIISICFPSSETI